MLDSYMGMPIFSTGNEDADELLNGVIHTWSSDFSEMRIGKFTDGRRYVWPRWEDRGSGPQLVIEQIPVDMVEYETRNPLTGELEQLKLKSVYDWVNASGGHTQTTIRQIITKDVRIIQFDGTLPPGIESREIVESNKFGVFPIVCFYNEKLIHNADGRAEISQAEPHLKAYHDTALQALRSIRMIATPKPWFKLANFGAFMRRTFGFSQADLDAGRGEIDLERVQAILLEKEDSAGYLQAQSIITEMQSILDYHFSCIVDCTMPEYLYGGKMNTTNASLREQSPVWEKKIERKRMKEVGAWKELARIILAINNAAGTKNLAVDDIRIKWPEINPENAQEKAAVAASLSTAFASISAQNIVSPETAHRVLKHYLPEISELLGDYRDDEAGKIVNGVMFRARVDQVLERLTDGDVRGLDSETRKELMSLIKGGVTA